MLGRLDVSKRVKKGEVIPITKEILQRDEATEQSARMTAIYLDKKPLPQSHALIGKAQTVREHILAMSLFPNIYNKHLVETEY